MVNNFLKYKALDYFIRSENRIFNLNKTPTPMLKNIIKTNFNIDLEYDNKMIQTEDIILVSNKEVVLKEYIMYEGKKTLLVLLPESIRSDDYTIDNKITTIYNLLEDGSSIGNTIYSYQNKLVPLIIITFILSDMYAPFNQLADHIVEVLFDKDKLPDKCRDELIQVLKYLNSITEEKDKIGILNNSELFAIIDKQIAQSIVRAYKRSNT